jgi:nucleotide-binding universal stress UspA family protein
MPSLATAGLRQIVFFHNVPLITEREIPCVDEEKAQAAHQHLSKALENVPEGVEVKIEIQPGRPIDNILKLSEEHQTDIILLGMPSRSLLNEKLFGSTTMGLAQRTNIPLMTLRPQLISTYTAEELDLRCQHLFRYLMIPYDDRKAAQYLAQRVQEQFKSHPKPTMSDCLLLWVIEEGGRRIPREQTQVQEAEQRTAEVKQDFSALSINVHTDVVIGDPIAKTMEAAMDYDISAIATSSDSLGRLLEWSVPSFTGEILRKSWHPVIYFPPDRD